MYEQVGSPWENPGLYLDMQEVPSLGDIGQTGVLQRLSASSGNESRYNALEKRAEALVDRYTFGRVRNMKEIPDAVKRCIAEIIVLEFEVANAGPALKSFSSDGYSETYAEPLTREELNAREYDLCLEYLANVEDDTGTPLLYMGV